MITQVTSVGLKYDHLCFYSIPLKKKVFKIKAPLYVKASIKKPKGVFNPLKAQSQFIA